MTPTKRTMTLAAMIPAALLVAAGPARADDDDPFAKRRTELGFGMLVGGYSVGPIGGPGVGIHANLARRMGDLSILGEYDLLTIGESGLDMDDPVRGVMHRIGVMARYNFVEIGGGRKTPVQGAFWVEGGVGRQYVYWDEGGKLTRDDVGLGFGIQTNFVIGKDKPKPKYIGVYYAFRATVANAPDIDPDAPLVCGGPCDEPTGPSPYDLGLFFNMGVSWGR